MGSSPFPSPGLGEAEIRESPSSSLVVFSLPPTSLQPDRYSPNGYWGKPRTSKRENTPPIPVEQAGIRQPADRGCVMPWTPVSELHCSLMYRTPPGQRRRACGRKGRGLYCNATTRLLHRLATETEPQAAAVRSKPKTTGRMQRSFLLQRFGSAVHLETSLPTRETKPARGARHYFPLGSFEVFFRHRKLTTRTLWQSQRCMTTFVRTGLQTAPAHPSTAACA